MRLVDADAYAYEMKKRQKACLRWKENAVLDGDEETRLRADGALATFVEAKLILNKVPTIDAVPVVRCRECKVKDEERCPWWHGVPEDEFYCAWGERRDDD